MDVIFKYPRTAHLEGSGLQVGDEDLDVVLFGTLEGRYLIIEEKMDGANSAVSFSSQGELRLQSRGHYLTGGPRERQFDLLKAWARRYASALWGVLGARFVLYGEWLYAKHTIYYTDLPHYFLEFDVLDRETGVFLDTPSRRALLRDAPFVIAVRVLHEGAVASLDALRALVGPSRFINGDHLARLRAVCNERGINGERALSETDPTTSMEGLYVKVEEGGAVTGRYKYVRSGFLQTVVDSGSHWQNRPLVPNGLGAGISLF
jgi:hypothetical protein